MSKMMSLWRAVNGIPETDSIPKVTLYKEAIDIPKMPKLEDFEEEPKEDEKDDPELDKDLNKEENKIGVNDLDENDNGKIDDDEMHDMFDDIFGDDENDNSDINIDDSDSEGSVDELNNDENSDDDMNFDVPEFGSEDNIEKTEEDETNPEVNPDMETDDEKTISQIDEENRSKLVADKMVELYESYREQIKSLSNLEVPLDKEKRIRPIIKEYIRVMKLLYAYITEHSKKDTSYIKIKRFAEFKYLFVVLDQQLKLFIDEEKKDKNNTSGM